MYGIGPFISFRRPAWIMKILAIRELGYNRGIPPAGICELSLNTALTPFLFHWCDLSSRLIVQLIKANLVIAVFVETLILYCSGGARPAPVPEGDKCAADNADGNGLRTGCSPEATGEYVEDPRQGHPHPRAWGTLLILSICDRVNAIPVLLQISSSVSGY